MAEHLLRAQTISVANHIKARQSLIKCAVTWLATESGWALSKRSTICSRKLCWGSAAPVVITTDSCKAKGSDILSWNCQTTCVPCTCSTVFSASSFWRWSKQCNRYRNYAQQPLQPGFWCWQFFTTYQQLKTQPDDLLSIASWLEACSLKYNGLSLHTTNTPASSVPSSFIESSSTTASSLWISAYHSTKFHNNTFTL